MGNANVNGAPLDPTSRRSPAGERVIGDEVPGSGGATSLGQLTDVDPGVTPALGSILAGSGAVYNEQVAGADGTIIIADSGAPLGLSYVTNTLQRSYNGAPAVPQITVSVGNPFTRRSTGYVQDGNNPVDQIQNNAGGTILAVAFDGTRTIISTGAVAADVGLNGRATITVDLDNLEFLRQNRTVTQVGFFNWLSTLTRAGGSFGGFINLAGTFQFSATAGAFGMGNALIHAATWKNSTGVVANLGPAFLFANNAVYQADGAAITISQTRIFFDNTNYNVINAGTLTMPPGAVGHNSFYAGLTISAGVTINLRRGLYFPPRAGAGTLTEQAAVWIENLTGAATNTGIRSLMSAGAANRFILHTGTAISDFAGDVRCTGAARFDHPVSDAPGGGLLAILATIGGTGPTVAAQATWVRVRVAGALRWMPAWA